MNKKTLVIINTNTMTLDMLNGICKEIMPEVRIINIVDDSLLPEAKEKGVTPRVLSKMSMYVQCAEKSGADVILNQCSSVGEAVDMLKHMVSVPYIKIDAPMAEKAVSTGEKIAVIGTVASTLAPSCRLIEKTADDMGKKVVVTPCLLEGVIELLATEEGKVKHDELVLEEVYKQAEKSDVVVLAQASMYRIVKKLKPTKVPVLASPEIAINAVKEMLYK